VSDQDLAVLKRRLLDGLAVLTGENILSGSGHLSVRVPGGDTFLINPRFAGILADQQDICTVDLSGKRIAGEGPIPSETPIHATLYRHRPDVGSVLHCHSRHAILVGLLDTGLIPFNREARALGERVPMLDESHGINSQELADQMLAAMGDQHALFLRGHGVVVASPTIEGTCISAIQLERACEDQLLLLSFTTPRPMAGADRGRNAARLENPYRAWPFLLHKHAVRPRDEIKTAIRTLPEGEHY
jgi:ribulose-5-phosphate 4-epimerase/fuculose-1-phosphate aldolase